jgi:hypothetical protein
MLVESQRFLMPSRSFTSSLKQGALDRKYEYHQRPDTNGSKPVVWCVTTRQVREKQSELRAQMLKLQQRLAALESRPTQQPSKQQSTPSSQPACQVPVIDLTVEDDEQGAAPPSPPSPPAEALDELAAQMLQMGMRELIVLDE